MLIVSLPDVLRVSLIPPDPALRDDALAVGPTVVVKVVIPSFELSSVCVNQAVVVDPSIDAFAFVPVYESDRVLLEASPSLPPPEILEKLADEDAFPCFVADSTPASDFLVPESLPRDVSMDGIVVNPLKPGVDSKVGALVVVCEICTSVLAVRPDFASECSALDLVTSVEEVPETLDAKDVVVRLMLVDVILEYNARNSSGRDPRAEITNVQTTAKR